MDITEIKVNDHNSVKRFIHFGLMILLGVSLLSGYLLSFLGIFEGTELGGIIFSLFILSAIPILLNYFYFVLARFGLLSSKISTIFNVYYTPSLMVHSGIYTIVIGLAFAHSLLVINQSIYCMILILILGLLWMIEYILWLKNWPLYTKADRNMIFIYWVVLFGLLIGLPFHARTWSLFWVSALPTITFGSLFLVIIQDFKDRRTNTRKFEIQSSVT
ncbi:MAG: hypothetical protein ACFFAE_18055 [Candidatus Hodarchaeota archaeon]